MDGLELYGFFSTRIKKIEGELRELTKQHNLNCIITSGLQTTSDGKVGYVSCLPHGDVTEESLDGTFLITENSNSLKILTEVTWGNGVIVAEIGSVTIRFDESNESMLAIWSEMEAKLIKILSQTLFQFLDLK